MKKFAQSFIGIIGVSSIAVTGCYDAEPPFEKQRNRLERGSDGQASPMQSNLASIQSINANMDLEPIGLERMAEEDEGNRLIFRCLFDGLTRVGPDGSAQPAVAERIQVSADYSTYIFHLRKSVWSDGTAVTSRDFIEGWKRLLSAPSSIEVASKLFVIKNGSRFHAGQASESQLGLFAPDDNTLIVALEGSIPYFLELAATREFLPWHPKSSETDSKQDLTLIGNGPFLLKEWRKGQSIALVKNPSYWDVREVKVTDLTITFEKNAQQASERFFRGELDFSAGALHVEATYEKRLKTLASSKTEVIFLNTGKTFLSNAHIRCGLCYALNRKEIVEAVSKGIFLPATSLVPPVLTEQAEIYFSDHDLDRARSMFRQGLAELSITRRDIGDVCLIYVPDPLNKQTAELIKSQWLSVLGFEVKLEEVSEEEISKAIAAKNYDMVLKSSSPAIPNEVMALEEFLLPNKNALNTGWDNFLYNERMYQSRLAISSGQRGVFIKEAKEILMAEMPLIPLYYKMERYLQAQQLLGVVITASGEVDFRWAYKEQMN